MPLWVHHHRTDYCSHQTTGERKNPIWGPKLYLQQPVTALEVVSHISTNWCLRDQPQITFQVTVANILNIQQYMELSWSTVS